MATLTKDIATKVSTEGPRMPNLRCIIIYISVLIAVHFPTLAAQRLIDSYYPALNSKRDSIATFYVPSTIMPDGKSLPVITYNGNVISNAAEIQNMFQHQMPAAQYEVQSFDCHVINPNYIAESPQGHVSASGKNMSILISVSGYVKYGDSPSVPTRGFSENFVLAPNPDAAKAKDHGKHAKNWLIQSQTFRLVT